MRKLQEENDQERVEIVADLQQKERNRRLEKQKFAANTIPSPRSIDKLSEELEHELDADSLVNNMPRWMKLSADAMIKEVDEVHLENECLSKVAAVVSVRH